MQVYEGEVEGWLTRKPGTPNAVAGMRRIVDFLRAKLA